ncbi:MAG: MoaD/ThiS family protein [Planctomycetaceae bacterium]|nr:MoaD/ThiS family protein [Planctomycetaceae bacterium]
MRIRVQMFAIARQHAGADSVELEVPAGATVGELRESLFRRLPELGALGTRVLFAVDGEYAGDASPLRSDCEVACIPPVSGG